MTDSVAIILVSGGLDSMISAALAREAGYRLMALSFDYNQRHQIELAAASSHRSDAGCRAPYRDADGPAGVRRVGAHRRYRRAQAGRGGRHSRHLCAGAQHHLPQPRARLGRGFGRAATSISASTRSTIRAIPIAGREFIDGFEKLAELATKAGVEGAPFRIRAPLQHMTPGRHRARERAAGGWTWG